MATKTLTGTTQVTKERKNKKGGVKMELIGAPVIGKQQGPEPKIKSKKAIEKELIAQFGKDKKDLKTINALAKEIYESQFEKKEEVKMEQKTVEKQEEKKPVKRYIFNWDLQTRGEIWTPNENVTAIDATRISEDNSDFLNAEDHEFWTEEELDRVMGLIDGTKTNMTPDERTFQTILRNALWNNELEIEGAKQLVKFINNKRVLELKEYTIIIPRNIMEDEKKDNVLCDFNIRLLNLGLINRKIEIGSKNGMDAMELYDLQDKFYGHLNGLKFKISAGIFTKDFKKMYQMRFNGYTSVALTAFLDLDEVLIPAWYAKQHNIKKGDICLMFRHPIQNIFIAVKVAGFTGDRTIRVNSLVFTWLGGDHDGDKVEIVPIKTLLEDNADFFVDGRKEDFLNEIEKLFPSNIYKDAGLSQLIPGGPEDSDYKIEIYSLEEMLEASEKSQKYVEEVNAKDYLANQQGTILNMRTVKDGTGVAGFFCNNFMETAELAGEDLIVARNICNIIQQAALDSKHDAATGEGYKATVWAKIATLFNNSYALKQMGEVGIAQKLVDIMEKTDVEQVTTVMTGKKRGIRRNKKEEESKLIDTVVSDAYDGTLKINQDVEHLLGKKEVELLARVMKYKANKLAGMKLKGGQFEQPHKSYKGFNRDIKSKTYKKNINLVGTTNYIYSKAWEITEPLEPANKLDYYIENIEHVINAIKTDVLERVVDLKNKNEWVRDTKKDGNPADFEKGGKYESFRMFFDCFKHYGFEVMSIYTRVYFKKENGEYKKIIDKNGKEKYVFERTLYVTWKGFSGAFSVEFPFIDKYGVFTNEESTYVGMASITEEQKAKILKGNDKNIELLHCYQYICKQLKVRRVNYDGKEELYDSTYFSNRVAAGKMEYTLKSKLKQILRHAKEMAWQEDAGTPIVWIDKYLSDMALEQYKNNVFLNFSYDDLVKCKSSITGLDLLTGSTAEPGKRVQLADNWKTTIQDGKMYLVRKKNANGGELGDHVCSYNMSIPSLAKTSAKRQNASTIKSTYQLVVPQTYKRHFVGNDFDEKIKNSCLRTMFVAKIGIPAMFRDIKKAKRFTKLGLLPNTNDCFIISDLGQELLRTRFRKPGTQDVIEYLPETGAKKIGTGRDKGSITSIMKDYVPVVDYVCNNGVEADNLEKALQEIRGELHHTIRNGNVVTFKLDVIANPSIGRDNVAALTLQSCKEISNMLEDKYEVMPIEEAAKINVKELVRSRQFNHTVRIVDTNDWNNTVLTFKNVPIMMEDFFVQPQHDNQFYNKERENVSLNYHQVIDGMKCLLPSLYYSMLASLNYSRIKEYMLCLGVEYIQKAITDIPLNNSNKIEFDCDEDTELMDLADL